MWVRENTIYFIDLKVSRNKAHKALSKQIKSIDQTKAKKLLKLYLERCKYRHAFAFLQFRRLLPGAKLHDLLELFNARKATLLEELAEVRRRIRQKLYNKKALVENEEDEDDEKD